jgi:fumarylacetoacetase
LRTWVHGADASGFGLENLPYGIVRRPGEAPRPAVRIGDFALELVHLLDGDAFAAPTLNPFLALGPHAWADARRRIRALLTDRSAAEPWLTPLSTLEVLLPIAPGDYVDFFASLEHATNVGRRFRPDDPLPQAWRHVPIGYHGRAGSVVVSGTPVDRPSGLRGPGDFGPERRLDFELELGIVTGDRDPFGVVLLNDWSAREIQRFEYVPLGPFLGKSFATSISPWVVPLEALPLADPPAQDPPPVDYLRLESPWALDVEVEAEVNGEVIARSNTKELYWTVDQMLAHATVNGAELRAGDLFGTGTISSPGNPGCLLERDGPFLEDGDEVVLRGRAGDVSLGEVTGVVTSAESVPSRA